MPLMHSDGVLRGETKMESHRKERRGSFHGTCLVPVIGLFSEGFG
jgi:hypothetical protein